MAQENKNNSKKKPADKPDPYGSIKLALSVIAAFGTVAYVLGRLRTEAYYNALGIAPGLLSFSTEDYMFSSVNLVIICAWASFLLYLCYYAYKKEGDKKEGEMFFWLPLHPGKGTRKEKAVNILVITLLIIVAVIVLVCLYSGFVGIYVRGFIGFMIGLAVGVFMQLLYSAVRWLVKPETRRKRHFLIFFIGLVALVLWLPSISSHLARIEARADIYTFSKAVIISENALHPQLQSSPQSQNKSVEVSVITTNNDMTYVLKPIVDSDEVNQDVDSYERWQVYVIQNRNIETIIFAGNSS